MRLFIVQDQPKSEIYDLDGNIFHPKLRENIEIGMIVGIRVFQKKILRNGKEKDIIHSYRQYQKIRKKYIEYLEMKRKAFDTLLIEVQRKQEELKAEILNNTKIKRNLKKQMSMCKEKINQDHKIELKEKTRREIVEIGNKIRKIEKEIKKKEKILNSLSDVTTEPYFSKSILRSECGISKTLFDILSKEDDFLEELSTIWKIKKENKPWEELIFLKIIKKANHKLYGEVIDKFRRTKRYCSLKAGDILSILPKQILYVPTELNKKSRVKSYFKTDYCFKFYQTKCITDWNGVFLDNSILDHIVPGTEVRIQLKQRGFENGTTWYVHILEVNGDYLYGELLDHYLLEGFANCNLKAGNILRFNKQSIIEIPLVWNSHLEPFSRFRNKDRIGYPITGYRLDNSYIDI